MDRRLTLRNVSKTELADQGAPDRVEREPGAFWPRILGATG